MATLIACLGNDAGTAKHVGLLIQAEQWDSIYLIRDETQPKVPSPKNVTYITLDTTRYLSELVQEIHSHLGKIKEIEVMVNIVSGNGKMHMATLAALLKSGLGIRLVAMSPKGMIEL